MKKEHVSIGLSNKRLAIIILVSGVFFSIFSLLSKYFILGEWDWYRIVEFWEMTWFVPVMVVIIACSGTESENIK